MAGIFLVRRSSFDTDPAFPLEDGPLTPLDPETLGVQVPPADFTALVGDAFGPLELQHARLDAGHQTLTEHSQPTRIEAADAQLLSPAGDRHAAIVATVDQADPSDVVALTGAYQSSIASQSGVYDGDPPHPSPVPEPGYYLVDPSLGPVPQPPVRGPLIPGA